MNPLPQHVIVREVIGDGLEAADRLQRVAPARDGGAEGMAQLLDPRPHQGGRDEPFVDVHRAELRPELRARHAAVEARHHSGVPVLEATGDGRDVIRPDPHVGVGDDEGVVLGVAQQVRQVADLEVGADRAIVDDQRQLDGGEVADESIDHRDGRIVVVADAAENLEGGVVLTAQRGEVVVELSVVAAQRLEDRDRRRSPRPCRAPARVPRDARERDHPVDRREDHRREEDEIDRGQINEPGAQSQRRDQDGEERHAGDDDASDPLHIASLLVGVIGPRDRLAVAERESRRLHVRWMRRGASRPTTRRGDVQTSSLGGE